MKTTINAKTDEELSRAIEKTIEKIREASAGAHHHREEATRLEQERETLLGCNEQLIAERNRREGRKRREESGQPHGPRLSRAEGKAGIEQRRLAELADQKRKLGIADFEREVADSLKPWPAPLTDEDMRPWKGFDSPAPSDAFQLLRAATLYEYSRESRRMRGLALMALKLRAWAKSRNSKRRTTKPRKADGGNADPDEWEKGGGLEGAVACDVEDFAGFEGLSLRDAWKSLGSHLELLIELGQFLADNIPFRTVWNQHREAVTGTQWWKRGGELRETCALFVPPAGFAPRHLVAKITTESEFLNALEFGSGEKPTEEERREKYKKDRDDARQKAGLGKDGIEIIAVEINWNRRTADISDCLLDMIKKERPLDFPEPRGKEGTGQLSVHELPLWQLAAMRAVWANPTAKLEREFSLRNPRSKNVLPANKTQAAAKCAREILKELFPWETSWEHAATFASKTKAAKPKKKRDRSWQVPEHCWQVPDHLA